MKLRIAVPILGLLLALATVLSVGCSSPHPRRVPLGEPFPQVLGNRLDETPVTLPDAYGGRPVILLVGYVQEAQFDGDRWLLGLLQGEVDAQIVEVPTIVGWVPGLLAGVIDEGMRGGIPPEDWSTVVTVYDDADRIARFTGNEASRNMRVLLLDAAGTVRWFHDEGYSARELLELDAALQALPR